jgi:hypothetical protein
MGDKPLKLIQSMTRQHRADHGCGAYTFEDGPGLARSRERTTYADPGKSPQVNSLLSSQRRIRNRRRNQGRPDAAPHRQGPRNRGGQCKASARGLRLRLDLAREPGRDRRSRDRQRRHRTERAAGKSPAVLRFAQPSAPRCAHFHRQRRSAGARRRTRAAKAHRARKSFAGPAAIAAQA